MTLQLGDCVPDFQADTTHGPIGFFDWLGGDWAVLSAHPKQFRPVCATELGQLAHMSRDFERAGVKLMMLNADTLYAADRWAEDVRDTQGAAIPFPIAADPDCRIANLYGMVHPAISAVAPMRVSMIIDPARKLRAMIVMPSSLGRDFGAILNMCRSLQMTDRHGVATPAGWTDGGDVLIVPGMPEEEAQRRFPAGWRELRPYLRVVEQPEPALPLSAGR